MEENMQEANVTETVTPTENQGVTQEQEQTTKQEKTFSETEFQSEVDRRVSKALEKARAEAEQERLKAEGKWKELYEQQEQRAKKAEYLANVQRIFTQKNIPDFSDVILNFNPTSLDSIEALISKVIEVSDARTQSEVLTRLETKKPIQNTSPVRSFETMTADEILKLSPEMIAEWRKSKGIY